MDRAAESGLEVELATGPEVVVQPYTEKYITTSGATSRPYSSPTDTSVQSHRKSQSRFKNVLILVIVGFICLAVAIGAGLGAGLADQHKSSSSSEAPTANTRNNDTPPTVTKTGNAPVTVTQTGPALAIAPTTATLPSVSCPAANGSTYTATNKPLPTLAPDLQLQIPEQTLLFEVLCNTNLGEPGSVIDVQIIVNVSTLSQCLDECALYSFRTRLEHFPELACTAVAWGRGDFQGSGDAEILCWLKNHATLESYNLTQNGTGNGGVDGGVLLL